MGANLGLDVMRTWVEAICHGRWQMADADDDDADDDDADRWQTQTQKLTMTLHTWETTWDITFLFAKGPCKERRWGRREVVEVAAWRARAALGTCEVATCDRRATLGA